MKKFGFSDLPSGKVVGKAELEDVIKFDKESWKQDKKTCANWMPYRKYGFVLKNVRRVKPKEAKGKLGFFEVYSAFIQNNW